MKNKKDGKNNTIRTKRSHKFLLIISSIASALILVELTLRIIGFFYLPKSTKTGEDAFDIKDKQNTYTILCIGESTTAGVPVPDMDSDDISYPTLLYKTLNKMNTGIDFKVINDGIPGATTFTLLTRLENNLDRYNPDMVICMIGTNDTGITLPYKKGFLNWIFSLLYKLKISKIIVQGPLKFLKYRSRTNVFERDKNSVNQYYHDKFGHYTIEIEPAVFLKKRGFPINDNNLKKSVSHYNSGRINDAVNQAEIALKKRPDSIPAKLYMAEIYFSISDFDQAIKLYEEVLHQKNDDPVIFIKLAKCHEMKADFKEAEKIYLELIDKFPDDYNVNIALVSFYMIKFEIYSRLNYPLDKRNMIKEEIEKLCQKCIDLEPENLLGYFQTGKFYLKKGDYEEALKYLKTAYKLENKKNYRGFFDFNEQPARYLALCYESMGQLDKAIEVLLPLSRQYDNPVILKYLANLHGYRGDIPNAEAMLNKAEVIESKQFISGYRQNYRLITGTILERGCKMIAMEHPLRSIDSLKKILEDIEAVIFVSNEFNFKKALEKESYNSFFIDMYAGDFGHCTERGNMLIVENLMNNILDEVK